MITSLALAILTLLATGAIAIFRNRRARQAAMAELRARGLEGRVPILMPVCGRPQYLHQVLAALAQVRGIDQAVLILSQDGRNRQVSALIDGIAFCDKVVIRHTRPFCGLLAWFWDSLHAASVNIRFLLDTAFSGSEAPYAIVLEDDLVPSPDFLAYFAWAARHCLADPRVLSVTGFNLLSRDDPAQGYDPRRHPCRLIENRTQGRPKFSGWSWAIAASQWQRIRPHWSVLSWDIGLDKTQRRLGLVSYKPALARVKNIGMQGGINFTEEEGNPKWTGLLLADAPCAEDCPPEILADDPVVPAFADRAPAEAVANERTRTRGRRRWLAALALAAAITEALWLGWRP
jgi:hypothetical protein